ncbi:hypothetical protein DPMN_032292 [Dreissena polymorpha]|uniref:Uncharacterized protein n=1 Tax=Dreissena polymorpha TaxID=45954 RepID=A0A9D4RJX0_DREPO|nr:hypothetical protein DPMN_032292 [Dreissena polymorpha]
MNRESPGRTGAAPGQPGRHREQPGRHNSSIGAKTDHGRATSTPRWSPSECR